MKGLNVILNEDVQLHDVQVKVVDKVMLDFNENKERLILNIPLQFGKTNILLELVNRLVGNNFSVLFLTNGPSILQQYLAFIDEKTDSIWPYRFDTMNNYINDIESNFDYDYIIFDFTPEMNGPRFQGAFKKHKNANVLITNYLSITDLESLQWFDKPFEISYEYKLEEAIERDETKVFLYAPFDNPLNVHPKDQLEIIITNMELNVNSKQSYLSIVVAATSEDAIEISHELKSRDKFRSSKIHVIGQYEPGNILDDDLAIDFIADYSAIVIGTLSQLLTLRIDRCSKIFLLCRIEDFLAINQLIGRYLRQINADDKLEIFDYPHTYYEHLMSVDSDYDFIELMNEHISITEENTAIKMLTNRNPSMLNDSVEHRDLLSMNREAKVFKHLIKQEDNTPLAIGIFGEWGSGKSFFLRTIQEELKAEKETVFQIKFNAWHYSDTNLILSLSNHIFERLNMEVIKKTDAKTEVIKEHVDQLETQKKSLVDFKDENDKKIETLEGEYETQRNELLDVSYDKLIAGTDNPLVKNAISLFKLKKDAKEYYEKAKTIRGRFKLFVGMEQNRTNIMMLLPIIILLLGPWLLDLLKLLTIDSNIKSLIRIVQLLGLALSSPVLHKAVTNVTKVINELDEFSEKQEALIKKQIGIEGLKKKSTKLQGDINGIDAEIAQAKTGDYIAYLLGERIHNRNYHEHLGIIHHLRKDLELLSDYLLDENNSTKINKVVLYIDDLDRCPADKVAQVLEAVHLLLSFKVFVVFVAADMKWISKCLYMNHGDKKMLTKATKESLLFAYDYMEKIFQLTYKPQALHGETSVKFISGLCTDLVAKKEVKRQIIQETRKEIDEITEIIEEKSVFEQPFEQPKVQTTPVTDQSIAVDIKLDEEEIKRLKEILALVNSTPRRLKRFMNTYQMIRASYDTSRTTYEIMILLVMIIYYPDEQNLFVDNLSQSLKLSDYIYLVNDKEEKHDFLEAIVKSEFAKEMDQLELLRWLPVVNRYSFFPCEE